MNLETILPPGLWEAIRTNYEKRDFTAAILDCCYYISDILRQKSGSDGDGVPLVGQALGGTSPKIRIAKDQSETEQNIQKGIESILRGFYQAIRNPRSHKKILDSADDGLSIILFCGFLVRQIDKAKAVASKDELIRRVLDKDFVPSQQYAQLLIDEIPPRLRLEVLLGVYEKRAEWNTRTVLHFNSLMLTQMSDEQRLSVIELISDDLKSLDDDVVIRHIISGFPTIIWKELADISRLRIENKIISAITDGRYDSKGRRCLGGALATWSRTLLPHFLLKKELIKAVNAKMYSANPQERDYVLTYFLDEMFASFEKIDVRAIVSTVAYKLKIGESAFHDALCFSDQDNWSEALIGAYKNFVPKQDSALDDDVPF